MKEKVFFKEGLMKDTGHGIVVIANRCRQCGEVYFPKEERCLRCLGRDMEEIEAPKYGIMDTYTVIYRPVNLYPVPHGLCKVKFPNGMYVEMPMLIENKDKLERGNEFKNGSKIEVVIDALWEDDSHEYIGYKAKVVE